MNQQETVMNYGKVKVELCEGDTVRFLLSGELDHHSVKEMREIIDGALADHRPQKVILDLGKVSFTDSAGLGLVLGRYAKVKDYGGVIELCEVSEEFMRILRLAGTDKLMNIRKRQGRRFLF